MARVNGAAWVAALASVGAILLLWIGYSFLRDSPGICTGAAQAYRELRGRSLIRSDSAFRRLTLPERIAVYRADQRYGRPSSMDLSVIVADRDSGVAVELLNSLPRVGSADDTSIVLQLLEYAKCERGFRTGLDSVSLAKLGAAFALQIVG